MGIKDYKLRRFDFQVGFDNQFSVEEKDDGTWIAWADVEPILRDHSVLINLINKHDALKNELDKAKIEELSEIVKES